MSLTIKASLYRHWNHDPIETRRFSIDQEVATSFTYLMQKLAQIFPDLEADKTSVAYIDSDGDRVSISTDDELTEALSQFDGSIFRIRLKKNERLTKENHLPPFLSFLDNYLKGAAGDNPFQSFFSPQHNAQEKPSAEEEPKPKEDNSTEEKKQSNSSSQGPYHPGVICDGCSGSIYGKRYKCCQCPDYDLCEGCEGKGLHTDHDMYTIDKPACRPPWMGGPRGGCYGQRSGPWGGPRGGCYRPHPGPWGGQLGPFEFKLWGHPGRCNPWFSGATCGQSAEPQGSNEHCPSNKDHHQQQQHHDESTTTTSGTNDDMETQQHENEVEKEPMTEQ